MELTKNLIIVVRVEWLGAQLKKLVGKPSYWCETPSPLVYICSHFDGPLTPPLSAKVVTECPQRAKVMELINTFITFFLAGRAKGHICISICGISILNIGKWCEKRLERNVFQLKGFMQIQWWIRYVTFKINKCSHLLLW